MMFPTIHLNGTSARSLLDDIEEASQALMVAQNTLRAMTPNARDYYPEGPLAIGVAIEEHQMRIDKVRAIRKELTEIQESILEQKAGKKARDVTQIGWSIPPPE